ncbi:hypothetical protein QYM36_008173 [Artemia franciscana]|uniref:Reverse transcriptase zinc-binding domain-containing protein n=1 Tax=Artemia franciscana TaxID=6661 RepID=A0AA88IHT4_ARTSF|nr:hypothetical protein QYM36_008173 [Artemia franciscana]
MYLEITEYIYVNHEMKRPEKKVIIFRMRTGHGKTKKMLKRWNMTDSSDCNVCGVEENLQHIIMECKKYETATSRLKEQVENRGIQFRIKELLGKAAKNKQRETVKYLGQCVKDTGLIDAL